MQFNADTPTTPAEIFFQTTSQGLTSWYFVLREGVHIEIQLGRSIQNILLLDFNLEQDTIQERISTIFLNRNPVDDLQTPVSTKNSTLTLSGAMPGFMGACMRVNSPYAPMRGSISEHQSGHPDSTEDHSRGPIKLKLFNLLVPEIGPKILRKGILLSRQRLEELLEQLPAGFWQSCKQAELNNIPLSCGPRAILEGMQGYDHARVTVES